MNRELAASAAGGKAMPDIAAPEAASLSAPAPRRRFGGRLLHALLVVIMLELGLVLLILPWTRDWSTNFWTLRWPQLWKYWVSPYTRGVISGLGLLNLWYGTEEIVPHGGAASPRGKTRI